MKVEDWSSAKTLAPLYRELKALDLLEHVAELEAFGFTVLPPETVGPPEQHEAVREALLRVACERKQCTEDELAEVFRDGQELLRFMLWDRSAVREDPADAGRDGADRIPARHQLHPEPLRRLGERRWRGAHRRSLRLGAVRDAHLPAGALHRELQLSALRLQQGGRRLGLRARQPPLAALAVARGVGVLGRSLPSGGSPARLHDHLGRPHLARFLSPPDRRPAADDARHLLPGAHADPGAVPAPPSPRRRWIAIRCALDA